MRSAVEVAAALEVPWPARAGRPASLPHRASSPHEGGLTASRARSERARPRERRVRGRRAPPAAHPAAACLSLSMAQLYLDLEETEHVFEGRWLWSAGRRNVAEFRRGDYLGPPAPATHRGSARLRRAGLGSSAARARASPDPCALRRLRLQSGELLLLFRRGRHGPRVPRRRDHQHALGRAACLCAAGAQAEWQAGAWRWSFDKAFHVSPFMPMNRRYGWRASEPGKSLRVHIDVLDAHGASSTRRSCSSAGRSMPPPCAASCGAIRS